MPAFGPVSRRDLVRYPKRLDLEGPYSGKKHDFMVKGDLTPRTPNPHKGDISKLASPKKNGEAFDDRDRNV